MLWARQAAEKRWARQAAAKHNLEMSTGLKELQRGKALSALCGGGGGLNLRNPL
jgi:hypothetical protein